MAQAARDLGVGWHTAMAAVCDYGQPLVDDPARLDGLEALGLDQTVMLHAGPRRWEHEVLAYRTTRLSNGRTEAVNMLIEEVGKIGHGFRNLDNYRLRLLLRCGVTWKTRPAARIRGRNHAWSRRASLPETASWGTPHNSTQVFIAGRG